MFHGKENKFEVTVKKFEVKNELKLFRNENVNSAMDEKENLLGKPCKPLNCFENYVGKLNEVCSRRSIRSPDYNVYVTENGEFIFQCKMFDNSVTQGRSKSKKDAKHKAAQAMLQVLNEREEARCQQFSVFSASAENVSIPIVKERENINTKVSSSAKPFTNHVGKLNESFESYRKLPKYRFCGIEKDEFIIECKIYDNTITRGQSKSKKDAKQKAAEAMLLVLNHSRESQNIKEELMCPNHLEFVKPTKNLTENVTEPFENLTNSTLSEKENINIKLRSSVGSLQNYVGKFNKTFVIVPETENDEPITECTIVEQPKTAEVLLGILNNSEKYKYENEELRKDREELILSNTTVNLTENESIRLSAPTDPSNKIYYKSKLMREEPKFKQDFKPKAAKAITVMNDSDKWKNHREKVLRYISNNQTAQNISTSTLNITDNENFRLSSQQFENDIETRAATYKNKKKHFSHRVCGKLYSGESRYEKEVKVIKRAKSLSSPILNAIENVSDELGSSDEQFENHVGKLNKTFHKSKKHSFRRSCRRIENGKLAREKKLKPKASEVLLDVLSDSETSRYDREESTRQKYMEFYKCAKSFPLPSFNVRKNRRFHTNSRAETVENYVKKLDEEYYKKTKQHPWYRVSGTENGKFILECIINDTITRGQSRCKKQAKQKAAKEMLEILAGSGKMMSQRSKSLEEHKMRNNQRKLLLGIDTDIIVKRNDVPRLTNSFRSLGNNSSVQFENYIGNLNEICFKQMLRHPLYSTFQIVSGEFITKCEMFDKTFSHGRSTTKKEAKQEAAKAMIKMIRYRGRQDTRSFQIGKFSEFLSIITENNNVCSRADMPSLSTDENDNLLESPIVSFENHVGKLNDFCIKEMYKAPTYIEHVSENGQFTCECKVINGTTETTQGRSMHKKDAKHKAAEKMIKILMESSKLKYRSLMASVTIIDTTDCSPQKPLQDFNNQVAIKQSDWSSVENMSEQELLMELKNLNISYTITAVRKTTNALKLKTKQTSDYKSLTFISTGENRSKIHLNLLRKAVFGLGILMT